MADIKQAARWMLQGKKVKRAIYHNWILAVGHGKYVRWFDSAATTYHIAEFDVNDLLANDWEIAQ